MSSQPDHAHPTLVDKFRSHVNRRKREPISPQFCNRISPPWYFVTISSAMVLAQTVAFPLLYEHSPFWLGVQRIVSTVIFTEIMVNWLCIRYVKSVYDPALHGSRNSANESVLAGLDSEIKIKLKTETQSNEDYKNSIFKTAAITTSDNGYKSANNQFQDKTKTNKDRHENGGQFVSPEIDVEIDRQNDVDKSDKFTVYIATGLPDHTGQPKRTPYPYWSWKPCLFCNRYRPPRCHHCTVCRACVLKRDHHCYFTGSCIGFHNQRHFIVFNFWASIGTIYAVIHAMLFLIMLSATVADLFLPLGFARFIFGYISFRSLFIITISWSIGLFTAYSTTFLYEQIILVKSSMTSFESDSKVKVYDSRNLSERLGSVFGEMWWVNFIWPVHLWYGPREDPVDWPTIKK